MWIKIQNVVFYTSCKTCHARLWATSYVYAWNSDITIRWLYLNTIWMRYARKSSRYGGWNFERIPTEMSPITLDVRNCSTDIKGHAVYEYMSCVHGENYGWYYISPQFCNVRVHLKWYTGAFMNKLKLNNEWSHFVTSGDCCWIMLTIFSIVCNDSLTCWGKLYGERNFKQ